MDALPLLTTSERRAFKRCPAKWFWEYREGLRKDDVSTALWFGIGVHEALAHFYGNLGYKRNNDFIDVWRAFCDEDDMSKVVRTRPFDDAEQVWVDAKALGEAMLTGHRNKWGQDSEWDVIAIERPFQILIPDPRSDTADLAAFTSTWDGVKRDKSTKRIGLMEHKTAASISIGHLPMDDQGGSYWAFATMLLRSEGILGKKETIDVIDYNFLKKSLPDGRPKDAEGYGTNKPKKEHYVSRLMVAEETAPDGKPWDKLTIAKLVEATEVRGLTVIGDRSSIQPGELFERHTTTRTQKQRRMQVENIQRELIAMEPLRAGGVPFKNPTRDCSWECAFFTMCQLHDAGSDWEEFRDGTFQKKDPYDRYRKSA